MSNEKNPFLIEYTVGLNYIEPAVRQKIGVAGNHNAVELEFDIDTKLKETLASGTGNGHDGGGIRFRFDVYNAAGEVFRTESELLENVDTIRYQLQERDTRYGGVVKVVLVLTALDGSEVTKEVFCPAAQLQLLGAQYGANKYSYTELEQKVLNAAERATDAADEVLVIKEAYDSGKLKGEKGDKGEQGPQGIQGGKGEDGKDYILTEEDKSEIATVVPTHEKYFMITEQTEGGCTIALKPEYRGAAYKKLTADDAINGDGSLPDAVSDNGREQVGSKNRELPSEICIPLTVNGISVTGLAKGIFAFNDRIKRVVLQPNIKALNSYTFYRARNLEAVECTEQIESVGGYGFSYTRLKKVELPNLATKVSTSTFACCSLLEYVDIGSVTQIGNYAFVQAYKLSEIKIANPVTTIGSAAFWGCYNLRTVENLIKPNVTTIIGNGAFMMCRPTYNWDTLTGCDFGTYATSKQSHPTKFWEDVPFVPCENRALSYLEQNDLRWQHIVTDPDRNTTFKLGCEGFSAMGAWCSLNNVNVDDAREFLDICKKYGTEFKEVDNGYHTDRALAFYDAMGLSYTRVAASGFGTSSTAITNIYNALAEGKYVIITVPNMETATVGHAVGITGITPLGELIIQDPTNVGGWVLGIRGNSTGKIPIQNLINTKGHTTGIKAVILSKKAVT